MRQYLCIIYLLFISNILLSQVGIGTTTPTKDLDINGELRVRNLPTQSANTSNFLTTDVDGNIGQSSVFLPSSVASTVATTNIDQVVSGGNRIINNIDLGLSTTVTIPANREAIIIINYSVPVGISSFSEATGYYGIRFLKNNVEAVAGSRKFTCNNNIDRNSNMITISNLYSESFQSEPTERIITYTLNGYIEQISGINGPHTYRFNMWSPTGANFNWGRATITHQVFIN